MRRKRWPIIFSAALTGRQLGTDELGRPIMENQLYDPESTGDLVSNWDPRIPGGRVQSIPSLKIDHTFTDNAKISGYWSTTQTARHSKF